MRKPADEVKYAFHNRSECLKSQTFEQAPQKRKPFFLQGTTTITMKVENAIARTIGVLIDKDMKMTGHKKL